MPKLWHEQLWLSNNSKLWWAAILVMNEIWRYFDLNASFQFLGTSLDRWIMMDLVIIVDTILYFWECRFRSTKIAIWYSGWWHPRPSAHAQKQAREWSDSKAKENCVETSHLNTSPEFSSKKMLVHNLQVIVVVPFWVLLELHFPAPNTGLLIENYHHYLLEGMVSRPMFRSIHQV